MALSLDQVRQSLNRILALLTMTAEQVSEYVPALQEAIGWMRADRFEDVCKELAKTVQRRPVPAQFIAVYNRLREERHWPLEPNTCEACSVGVGPQRRSLGLVYKRLTYIATNQTGDVMVNCPVCKPHLPAFDETKWREPLELVK